MSRGFPARDDLWSEFLDRDIDTLLSGDIPDNEDLAGLTGFVSELAHFRPMTVDEEVVADFAARIDAAPMRSLNVSPRVETRAQGFFLAARRQVGAGLTGLMMLSGLTGVAWASDSAVPGDWNYGIDRALEVVGIGDGGARERLEELALLAGDPATPTAATERTDPSAVLPSPESLKEPTGSLAHAAEVVAVEREGESQTVRIEVSEILDYLSRVDQVDGAIISEMAKLIADQQRTSQDNRPDNPGKPDNPGRPDAPGKP